MPVVDLSTAYDDVKDEDKYPLLENADYDFTVTGAEVTTTQKGRPQIKWQLTFLNPENGRKNIITHNTVLPWNGPDGMDVSGVGILVAFCKAVGLPWSGTTIDTDAYIGRTGRATVYQKPRRVRNEDGEWVDDSDPANKVNDIKKFIYND